MPLPEEKVDLGQPVWRQLETKSVENELDLMNTFVN